MLSTWCRSRDKDYRLQLRGLGVHRFCAAAVRGQLIWPFCGRWRYASPHAGGGDSTPASLTYMAPSFRAGYAALPRAPEAREAASCPPSRMISPSATHSPALCEGWRPAASPKRPGGVWHNTTLHRGPDSSRTFLGDISPILASRSSIHDRTVVHSRP